MDANIIARIQELEIQQALLENNLPPHEHFESYGLREIKLKKLQQLMEIPEVLDLMIIAYAETQKNPANTWAQTKQKVIDYHTPKKIICSFCDNEKTINEVYFLDGKEREDKKTVICDKCESALHII